MDNLTHSLIGAALGQAGLKRRTGLAMPALIIGANLPDIDAGCVVWGIESLSMRRGITHGPIALVVLPVLLAGALWWFDRWQARHGKRPEGRLPVRFGWLLALSFIACLTHPLFDWFNNYGVRLLEPCSSQWLYGDTRFIIDPWIIAMLGLGVWLSLRRERGGAKTASGPSAAALAATAAYVLLNVGISSLAVSAVQWSAYTAKVANPIPGAFWRREMLWRNNGNAEPSWPPREIYGRALWSVPNNSAGWQRKERQGFTSMSDPRIAEWAKHDPAAQAFLFWSRMPVAELLDDRIVLRDQRFMDARLGDRFSVTLRPPQ